jgi:uncharacterized protein YunC (DUF1805 family)
MKISHYLTTAIACSLLAGTTLLHSGCVAVAVGAGAGTVAYVRGELKSTLDAKVETLAQASEWSLDELGIKRLDTKKDSVSAVITARTADDKKVEIHIKSITSRASDLTIRVGVFGDQRVSTVILDKIKSRM